MEKYPVIDMNNFFHHRNQGQTLVEALVATGVVMMLVTGLVVGMTSAVKTGQSNKTRSMATNLAQEAIEQVRNLRDTLGWNQFVNDYPANTYCMKFPFNNPEVDLFVKGLDDCVFTIAEGSVTYTFYRSVIFESITGSGGQADRINVTVNVTWKEGGKDRTSKTQTELTNWR